MKQIYLLIGTNIGNLKENLENALDQLNRNNIKIIKRSKIYKTKPWGKTDQPDFLNIAVEVETSFTPEVLLKKIKEIEKEMKRETVEKWGPRIIDIDILFYGSSQINQSDLIIPHSQFFNRQFAIVPLADIAPDFVPPFSQKKVKELISGEMDEGIEVYYN
ncbi:MAG: 2-amino-4-hydroxy-6-hydroxymethyldihydropteridine diphosphokinase [bacterium]